MNTSQESKKTRGEGKSSQKSVGPGLPIQGSIHTIKEYDHTDEDETGQENNNSFDRADSPLGPTDDHGISNRASLPLPNKTLSMQYRKGKSGIHTGVSNSFAQDGSEEYHDDDSPGLPYSSSKRLEHNEDTIKHSQNMRNILEEAKRERKKDLEAQASGKLLPIKLDRKPKARLQQQFKHPHRHHVELKQSPSGGSAKRLAQSFQTADNTPPHIDSKRVNKNSQRQSGRRRNDPADGL